MTHRPSTPLVAPEVRRSGVGAALLRSGEAWARARGCSELKVETQDINVGACRFYARQGFLLRSVDAKAYPDLPDEVQYLWYKTLDAASPVPAAFSVGIR